MEILTIIGLINTSIGAIWLAWIQVYERSKKRKRFSYLTRLQNHLDIQTKFLQESIESILVINEKFGYEAYNVKKETQKTKTIIDEAVSKINTLTHPENNLKQIIEHGPNQLWAFSMLGLGFVLQLVSKLLQMVG